MWEKTTRTSVLENERVDKRTEASVLNSYYMASSGGYIRYWKQGKANRAVLHYHQEWILLDDSHKSPPTVHSHTSIQVSIHTPELRLTGPSVAQKMEDNIKDLSRPQMYLFGELKNNLMLHSHIYAIISIKNSYSMRLLYCSIVVQ